MSENEPVSGGADSSKPAPVDATADNQKVGVITSATFEKLGKAVIEAIERYSKNSGYVTGSLLGLIVCALAWLAYTAMTLNHFDTAEKIIIGLISFLGGAAMFSGSPKK